MPLSFERFQGEGFFGNYFSSSSLNQDKIGIGIGEEDLVGCGGYVVGEPTSVLEALRSPASTTTTLSSSHGGSATAAVVTAGGGGDEIKCSSQMADFDLSVSSPWLIMDQQQHQQQQPGSAGFGVFDPGFGFGSGSGSGSVSGNVPVSENCSFPFQEPLLDPNPGLVFSQPPAKRFNSGSNQQQQQPVFPFSDPDPGRQFHFPFQQIPSSSSVPVQFSVPGMAAGDDQTVIIEQLFNAAELIGNQNQNDVVSDNNNNNTTTILAQGILARLNHHLLLNNNPFTRAASHIVEALLHNNDTSSLITPENLILRIAAYRSFSETSPFLQFVNFTANQSILELGFDQIHIIDFDIGYGGQWSSLMQELAGKGGGRNRGSLKLTVFAPPPSTVSDEFELRFTEENLRSFAGEVKIPFEIELLSIELLLNPAYWPLSLRSSEKEAIAVNLPLNSVVSGYLPLILRFLKQISPNVVVCSDRGCDRNDAPFPNFVIHALQYHTTLLESLDAGEDSDSSSIERFWVKPSIEKLLMKRRRWIERTPPWRSLFTQCGFTPASLSTTAEAQAECLLQRNNPVRGFHVEKRQSSSSLVLCWQRKELVTVSAWKC